MNASPHDEHPSSACWYCGRHHTGSICPRIKRIEYHENGCIKSVEFYRWEEREDD